MKFLPYIAAVLYLLFLTPLVEASDAVLGEVSTFESWYGVSERCVRISLFPNAN